MKKILLIFFLIILAGSAFTILSNKFLVKTTQRTQDIPSSNTNTPQPPQKSASELKQMIDNALADAAGTYAVVVKNLKTGESYYFNEHKIFEPGSLYKLWVMATAFNQIEKGKLKEDQVLSQKIEVLNEKFHISSEAAELKEGQITLTVKEALEKMIIISDNYSALLLSEKLRLSSVKAFLQQNNFNESSLGEPPQTTANDVALFFEKLDRGELADKENTEKMLDLLKRQTKNHKLPKYLPKETVIAHKTGEIGFFSHDAGIVFVSDGKYIIVIFSKTDNPSDAEEQIAKLSQEIFNYFAK